jgi:hypothetical protein
MTGKANQTTRGLSVNKDEISPRLTKEQRKEMTVQEIRNYNAKRLKEYRRAYALLYYYELEGKNELHIEKKEALVFYRQHKAQQALTA